MKKYLSAPSSQKQGSIILLLGLAWIGTFCFESCISPFPKSNHCIEKSEINDYLLMEFKEREKNGFYRNTFTEIDILKKDTLFRTNENDILIHDKNDCITFVKVGSPNLESMLGEYDFQSFVISVDKRVGSIGDVMYASIVKHREIKGSLAKIEINGLPLPEGWEAFLVNSYPFSIKVENTLEFNLNGKNYEVLELDLFVDPYDKDLNPDWKLKMFWCSDFGDMISITREANGSVNDYSFLSCYYDEGKEADAIKLVEELKKYVWGFSDLQIQF